MELLLQIVHLIMLEQFLNHISKHKLLTKNDKILLAISGGIDSMVMMHLFRQAGFQAGIAHCNYQLRGKESEQDMEFVRSKAQAYGFPLHLKNFQTRDYARAKGISIQMATRELRYEWFNELTMEHGYTVIASAHQLNDVLETILLNLIKGTGIDGLAGIPVKHQKVIRPLLFASRQQIESFALENKIEWREDSSNSSDYYQRNLIRHRVIPLLKEINPNLDETFADTLLRLNAAREFARLYLKDFSVRNIYYDGRHVLIRKEGILNQPFGAVTLWELVKDLGFNFDQCVDIVKPDRQAGQVFHTDKYDLTIDRDDFVLARKTNQERTRLTILPGDSRVEANELRLTLELIQVEQFTLSKDKRIAQLDADKIQYPVVWRHWQEGDRFIPLGMTQRKKVSDFLVDEKVDLPNKGAVTVLESEGEIVWVVGKRIADPYKVTDLTKTVLVVKSENK
ncbi:MAG TPA: tRNA lysidine(34) synthetase TilS [Cyclobacteriaceae bacterium]|nr:tRNA lysidine(34) synthetase TilS [Cyclobacteriaceae bacterium]